MSDLESRIQESYGRLGIGSTVYLLRDSEAEDDQLPDPSVVREVFKADVRQVDPDYRRGVYLLDWLDLRTRDDYEDGGIYTVSPREVFKLGELNALIRNRTPLPLPKASKLDKVLASNSGKFAAVVAAAMAETILERFVDDPRDASGQILHKR